MEHFYTIPFPKCLSYIRGLGLVHLSYVTPMYSRHKGRLTEAFSSEVVEEVSMHCRSLQHYKLIANLLRATFQPHMSHLLRARYMFPTSCLQGCPEVHLQSKLLYHTLIYNHGGKKIQDFNPRLYQRHHGHNTRTKISLATIITVPVNYSLTRFVRSFKWSFCTIR